MRAMSVLEGRSLLAVARSVDLEEGEMLAVDAAERNLALYRVEGKVFCTDNLCTHGRALLTDGWLDGKIIECPLHAGCFDIETGKGQGAPIECDVAVYRVEEREGEIFIEV